MVISTKPADKSATSSKKLISHNNTGIDDRVIPTYLFNVVAAVLMDQSIDPEVMIANTGLSLEALYDQQTRVSFRQAAQIFRNALRASTDPALGLTVARRECFSDWGVLGYAIASCKCAEESIEFSNRLYRTTTNLTELYSEKDGNTILTYATPTFSAWDIQPFLIEENFGGILNILRTLTENPNSPPLSPKEVQLSYAPPIYSRQYQAFFNCPVLFNCEVNKIVWRDKDARRPFNTYNPTSAKLALKLCEQLINESGSEPSLIQDIRCRLLRSPGNFPSIREIAAEMSVSERSLSRSLKNMGTSFQSILNEVREKIAIEYLTISELRLEDIAYLVGFSDAGNFHRAFKKWTGKPPTAFRRQSKLPL